MAGNKKIELNSAWSFNLYWPKREGQKVERWTFFPVSFRSFRRKAGGLYRGCHRPFMHRSWLRLLTEDVSANTEASCARMKKKTKKTLLPGYKSREALSIYYTANTFSTISRKRKWNGHISILVYPHALGTNTQYPRIVSNTFSTQCNAKVGIGRDYLLKSPQITAQRIKCDTHLNVCSTWKLMASKMGSGWLSSTSSMMNIRWYGNCWNSVWRISWSWNSTVATVPSTCCGKHASEYCRSFRLFRYPKARKHLEFNPPPPPPTRGVLNKLLKGEASPRGPNPHPFIYHFWHEMYPFPAQTFWQMIPLSRT